VKKVWKSDPPSKWPKCQINGQKWQFVKSEPPGPALFEFQGVPRDPVLRPKMTPSLLNGKSQHEFHLFHILHISRFTILWHFMNCAFWLNCHFMIVQCLIVIRPYSNKGEWELCVVVLPSFVYSMVYIRFSFVSCRGDYTGESFYIYTLVLPSVVF